MKPFVPICLAGMALVSAPALGQSAPAAVAAAAPDVAKKFIPGLAIANVQDVVAASNAVKNANEERQIVYKSQLAMVEARRLQINAEITPLVAKFNSDRQAGTVSQADLQQQAQAIQNLHRPASRNCKTCSRQSRCHRPMCRNRSTK